MRLITLGLAVLACVSLAGCGGHRGKCISGHYDYAIVSHDNGATSDVERQWQRDGVIECDAWEADSHAPE
jgi:hypothetical protein